MVRRFGTYHLFIALIWPTLAQNDLHCSHPYECLTPRQCAEKLPGRYTQKLFYRCMDNSKICCLQSTKLDVAPTEAPEPTESVYTGSHSTKYANSDGYAAQTEGSANNCNSCEHKHNTHSSGGQSHRGTPSPVPVGGQSHRGTSSPPPAGGQPHRGASSPVPAGGQPHRGASSPAPAGGQSHRGTAPDVPVGDQSQNNAGSPNVKFASHKNFHLLPTKCGTSDFPNRITEGEEANLGEFPWMALVGIRDRHGNLSWLCGGTLINYRYVLTAAHCIYRQNGTTPMVRLGEHDLKNATDCDKINNFCLDPPQDFAIKEVIVHEHWNSTTIKNDIALFRLPREVSESFSVSPICLPLDLAKRNATEDVKYEVAGWGKIDWNELSGSNVLRKGTLSSVSSDDCNLCKGKRKAQYCPITRKQMCAQGYKSVDVCKGDSGGPLMIEQQRTYQVGITSFKTSVHCGADNIPSLFTRVESYLEWILNNIRE